MRLHGTMRINWRGHLEIGGCDTVELAREFGTPLYVVDEELMRQNCRLFRSELARAYPKSRVAYAGKAFLTTAICRIVDEEGLGLDLVSGGELYTAAKAAFPAERILFHGNNKSPDELRLALTMGVGRIMVDNYLELERISELARRMRLTAPVILRITPGIDAHTHEYIKTGHIDTKFGFVLENGQAMQAVKKALAMPNVAVKGLHCHIGSQIFELEPFALAARRMVEFMASIREETGVTLEELDLGGGFGIVYQDQDSPPAVAGYMNAIAGAVTHAATKAQFPLPTVIIEPGRSIVGEAGTTLYTVGAVKEIPGVRTYMAVDGGMGDNPRPALYGAKYSAMIANKAACELDSVVSVAGKCCESGDMLIWNLPVASPEPGDILAVFSTGAYNYSMASNYNRLPRPAGVLVRDGQADLFIRRETYEDIVACDVIPRRLAVVEKAAAGVGK